jgi:hypothetical protein
VGPFQASPSFPATLDGSLGATAYRGCSATGFHLPQIRLATRVTIPGKCPLLGYFVDLVILRIPTIGPMVMSTRMAR